MLFRELRLSGLLSFGPDGVSLPMRPLNVLIGPNGCGKSNFLEAIALFRAAPGEVTGPISRSGGIREWRWKGPGASERPVLEAVLDLPGVEAVRHRIEFGDRGGGVVVAGEAIEPTPAEGWKAYFRPPRTPEAAQRVAEVDARADRSAAGEAAQSSARAVMRESADVVEFADGFQPRDSILRYAATPERPVLWNLKTEYEAIRMYRDRSFGPNAEVRVPASAHDRSDFLEEGAGNLALVLSHLQGETKTKFLEAAGELFDGIVDFRCPVTGGVVSLFLEEDGGRTIPASRLSDGTLRYLGLLAVLLHPEPPPVICIEEPELGLHPDLLPTLCDLMREASARSQLIVTTHSDILVEALREDPEAVVVCEKEEGQTTMRRLDREDLAESIERYGLGELWTSGELGGNRW